jgi:hypothetical protein
MCPGPAPNPVEGGGKVAIHTGVDDHEWDAFAQILVGEKVLAANGKITR